MKTIKQLENELARLRHELQSTTDPDEKAELDEKIDYIQDEVDDLEAWERDNAEYEEMTGTTAQDRYNDRNSYAIAHSEMIDRFRNEY
jgi:septal ring factor EnvC (AmiA/AmiB activator)